MARVAPKSSPKLPKPETRKYSKTGRNLQSGLTFLRRPSFRFAATGVPAGTVQAPCRTPQENALRRSAHTV